MSHEEKFSLNKENRHKVWNIDFDNNGSLQDKKLILNDHFMICFWLNDVLHFFLFKNILVQIKDHMNDEIKKCP